MTNSRSGAEFLIQSPVREVFSLPFMVLNKMVYRRTSLWEITINGITRLCPSYLPTDLRSDRIQISGELRWVGIGILCKNVVNLYPSWDALITVKFEYTTYIIVSGQRRKNFIVAEILCRGTNRIGPVGRIAGDDLMVEWEAFVWKTIELAISRHPVTGVTQEVFAASISAWLTNGW